MNSQDNVITQECVCNELFQRAIGGQINVQFPFSLLNLKHNDKVLVTITKI